MRFLHNSVTDEEGFILPDWWGENELEEAEADLVVKKLPFSDALAMVMSGEITDSSVGGLLKLPDLKGFNERLPTPYKR
jgi:hypothetical protein